MKPLDLRIHEKHPTLDAYRFGPSYTPYAIVATDKRFTDSELAAEYWAEEKWLGDLRSIAEKYPSYLQIEPVLLERVLTLYRLASSPHHDEDDQ